MICPRCTVAEIPPDASKCPLCGYAPDPRGGPGVMVSDAVDEMIRRELASEFQIDRTLRRTDDARSYLAADLPGRTITLAVVLRPEGQDPVAERRFLRAAEVARGLAHPHIVPVYAAGAHPLFFWWSSRFLEAQALSDLHRRLKTFDLGPCLHLVEQICSALNHAHRHGVSHGSLTSEKVLVDQNEWAFVADFGIDQALRGIPLKRQGGVTGDQRDLSTVVTRCLGLPETSSKFPAPVLNAVARASSPDPTTRFATVLDFVAALGAAEVAAPIPLTTPAPARIRRTPQARVLIPTSDASLFQRFRKLFLGAGAAGVVALIAWLLWPTQQTELHWYAPPPPPPAVRETPTAEVAIVPPAPAPAPTPSPAVPQSRAEPAATPPAGAVRPASVRPTPNATAGPANPPVQAKGRLWVNSTPWGQVYLDGELIGNTPQIELAIAAGPHQLRVAREGFASYERQIVIVAGQDLRLTDLVLTRP